APLAARVEPDGVRRNPRVAVASLGPDQSPGIGAVEIRDRLERLVTDQRRLVCKRLLEIGLGLSAPGAFERPNDGDAVVLAAFVGFVEVVLPDGLRPVLTEPGHQMSCAAGACVRDVVVRLIPSSPQRQRLQSPLWSL